MNVLVVDLAEEIVYAAPEVGLVIALATYFKRLADLGRGLGGFRGHGRLLIVVCVPSLAPFITIGVETGASGYGLVVFVPNRCVFITGW